MPLELSYFEVRCRGCGSKRVAFVKSDASDLGTIYCLGAKCQAQEVIEDTGERMDDEEGEG